MKEINKNFFDIIDMPEMFREYSQENNEKILAYMNNNLTIQKAWIEKGLGRWVNTNLFFYGKINISNNFRFNKVLKGKFTPPLVNNLHVINNMHGTFTGCEKLTSLDLSSWDTSNVTKMNSMFMWCRKLKKLDVSNWNTSKVTTMFQMFAGCQKLTTLDLSSFDTKRVTSISKMFEGCSGLISLDLSSFDTSKLTVMTIIFYGCTSLTSLDISSWDTSNVTNMYAMFTNCPSLKEIKCTKATKDKILSFDNTGLDSNFDGWVIV